MEQCPILPIDLPTFSWLISMLSKPMVLIVQNLIFSTDTLLNNVSVSVSVSFSSCCRVNSKHSSMRLCQSHYYLELHVLGNTCTWYHMFLVLHVLGMTCTWYYMYLVIHALGTTCTRYPFLLLTTK